MTKELIRKNRVEVVSFFFDENFAWNCHLTDPHFKKLFYIPLQRCGIKYQSNLSTTDLTTDLQKIWELEYIKWHHSPEYGKFTEQITQLTK
jgi:hypothetical protein